MNLTNPIGTYFYNEIILNLNNAANMLFFIEPYYVVNEAFYL